jgi:hypothetical protein
VVCTRDGRGRRDAVVTEGARGTGGSAVVDRCQVCGAGDLGSILFLGYLPPVNAMPEIGSRPTEQPAYPAELLRCRVCGLAQLGLIVDPQILFPPSYPYTSGTTRILRENFAELYRESTALFLGVPGDLVVDVGSNDGTLLANFAAGGRRVLGIEPTDTGRLAIERGIPTRIAFFSREVAREVAAEHGRAAVVTAANVFAHMERVHDVVDAVLEMLAPDGVFISESHYLLALIETVQFDTIYHEHLRYYSLGALERLLGMHDLEIVHAKRIPTHGGSIRVYAARRGTRAPSSDVRRLLADERSSLTADAFATFRRRVVSAKLGLHALLHGVRARGARVYGVGAPSRAATLMNYVGLDDGIVECVLEVPGSKKVGKYMPGTLVPVVDEERLVRDPPEYALLLSWHIADELCPKLKAKGFAGDFIIPLPEPRIVANADV